MILDSVAEDKTKALSTTRSNIDLDCLILQHSLIF